jgi:undecaprenyl diphosphate synthase
VSQVKIAPVQQILDYTNLPKHVAIIMDGNGRWAKRRGANRLFGHQKGVEALKRAIEASMDIGIPYLTVWAFSTENWGRPSDEVSGLMTLLRRYLQKDLADLHSRNICLKVVGLRDFLEPSLLKLIDQAVEITKNNTRLTLTIAFNYGGRADILATTKKLAQKVKAGDLSVDEIDEELFSAHTLTSYLPDPDLLIRTSSVKRLSNFMMWQCGYTELVFLDTYWPDFTKDDLIYALQQYQQCERKFGCISA